MQIIITYRQKRPGISMRVTKEGDIRVSAAYGIPKDEVLRFINDHKDWIDQAIKSMAQARSKSNDFYAQLPLTTAAECAEATRRLNSIIPPLLDKYQPLMGVKASSISYNRAKTRWGSCNPTTRRINFSAYVLLLPDWCIEHVVVHELTHLLVPNHSAEFYKIMDKFFPRWKEARKHTKCITHST